MIKFRKFSALIFAMIIAAVTLAAPVSAAAPVPGQGLDVVAVLDASGSMKHYGDDQANDDVGKTYLVPGMETLISVTSEQKYPVNMGVVIFSLPQNTVTVGDKLWELTDGVTPNTRNVDTLTDRVKSEYQYKTDTDQPNAVSEAMKLLETGSPNNKKLIILITDGINDDGQGNGASIDAKQPGVIDLAVQNDIMISTIVFNPREEDFSKIDEFAKATDGYSVQIKYPQDISDEIIQSVLGKIMGSGTIASDVTAFEEKIDVPELYEGSYVVAVNVILESPDVTNLSITSPGGVTIAGSESGGKLTVSYTDTTTIASLAVNEYGVWMLRGEKPAGVEVTYKYIVSGTSPNPPDDDEIVTETEPVTTTAEPEPEPETEVTTTAPETEPPEEETTARRVQAPPPEPVDYTLLIVLGVAAVALIAGAIIAVRFSKRPKLTGEILLEYNGGGYSKGPDAAELDTDKTRQTLYDLFDEAADDIVQNTGADETEVIKFFKKVVFEANSAGGLKAKTEGGVFSLFPGDNAYEFTANFTKPAEGTDDDDDDAERRKYSGNGEEDTVAMSFFLKYYDTVKED